MRKNEKILDDLASKKWLPYVRYESDFLWEGKAGEDGTEIPRFLQKPFIIFTSLIQIIVLFYFGALAVFMAYIEFQKTAEEATYFHLIPFFLLFLFMGYSTLRGEKDYSTQYRIIKDYVLISRFGGNYFKRRKLCAVPIEYIHHVHLLGYKNGTTSVLLYLNEDIEVFKGLNLGEYDIPTLNHLKDAEEVKEILEELIQAQNQAF